MEGRRKLSGLRRCNGIGAISNGGDTEYNHKGPTTILPAINAYFNASSLANIMSFHDVRKYYHIQYDSRKLSGFDESIYICIDVIKASRNRFKVQDLRSVKV